MEHQDWNPVFLGNNTTKNKVATYNKTISQKPPNPEKKIEAPSNLGKLIASARMGKPRDRIAQELGISSNILARWESGKDIPQNNDIAKIERVLKVKLPRVKKVKVSE